MKCNLSTLSVFTRNRSGASAVEFALVAPVFILMMMAVIVYGAYIGVVHGVQQLTAEAARASIAGLNDDERLSLAQDNITASVSSYPMLSPQRISVQSASTDPATSTFRVTVRYDASNMFIFALPSIVPAPSPTIVRTAAIQRGGY